MPDLVRRFLSFDTLLGVALVKIVYWTGLIAIGFGFLSGLFAALMAIAAGNIGGFVVGLLAVPTVSAVALVYWRFVCELFIVMFANHDRLTEIRDKIAYSQF